ncbi:methyl-accepting chemotaxis protein [Bosea sp. BK604]|uniref:methyl-accepting chemotaxis protein n=1 Tax=Bosea sp. BK604 TaxID=2512180 RepID=UPI0010436F64|nr:methyl-accepting chemotaxis protein [Bosea sp. BK604]TCR68919.1 methyl-accepting chemotaxis protein [Bosea sp. BK604]
MKKLLSGLSIRATLACIIAVMGLLIAGLAGQELWSTYWRRDAAVQVAQLSKLNENLFDALVSSRYERASLQTAIIMATDKNQSSIASYMTRRKEVDDAMAQAQAAIAAIRIPALSDAGRSLTANFDAIRKLRETVDAESKLAVPSRTAGLPQNVLTIGDRFLQSLEATSAVAENEIRSLSPRLSELIIARSMAWSVRAQAGTAGQMISSILAQGRPFTASEAETLKLADAQAAYGWQMLRGISGGEQAPAAIRSAIRKADRTYFSGQFTDLRDDVIKAMTTTGKTELTTDKWRESVIPALDTISEVSNAAITELNLKADDAASDLTWTLVQYAALFAGGMMIAIVGYMVVRSRVTGPIAQMTVAMRKLADGDLSVAVPYGDRRDEIGGMAAALNVFKENGLRVRALEEQERAEAAARLARAESMASVVTDVGEVVAAAAAGDFSARLQIEDADQQMQQLIAGINEINAVVDSATTEFAEALQAVAAGDLTSRIETGYRGRFANLKDAINETVDRLSATVRTIQVTASDVGLAAREINLGADDLSKRTEEQASSLEETAATTEELAASVKASAQASKQASTISGEAMRAAEQGGAIAGQAVEAMARIESASKKISDIIRVIDDIAFQTNLLALNAAVEAARAGDAGKGFAVVASEVRTLAQRSGEAAKDISALISSSNAEVNEGVTLVRQAGAALTEILQASQKVAATIADISTASGEQANGIDEMSQAVAHLDEMTQQNAALAEQSAASAASLSSRIGELNTLVAAFKTGHEQEAQAPMQLAQPQRVAATAHAAPRPRPSRAAAPAYAPPPLRAADKAAMATGAGSEPERLRKLAEAAFAQTKATPVRTPAKKVANAGNHDAGWEEF